VRNKVSLRAVGTAWRFLFVGMWTGEVVVCAGFCGEVGGF